MIQTASEHALGEALTERLEALLDALDELGERFTYRQTDRPPKPDHSAELGSSIDELLDIASTGLLITDVEGSIVKANAAFTQLVGLRSEDLLQTTLSELVPEDHRETYRDIYGELLRDGLVADRRFQVKSDDGIITVEIDARTFHPTGNSGREPRLIWEWRRVEPRDSFDAEFREAHQEQLLSRMAGGVAHEFKNILNIIYSWCDVGMRRTNDDSPVHTPFKYIKRAAQRGSTLTEGLVSYSREKGKEPEVLDLQVILETTIRIFEAVLPKTVELELDLPGEKVEVFFDRGELEQILLNLVLNARDAITDSGEIAISATYRQLDQDTDCAGGTIIEPGEYVEIRVCDDGCGMDEQTLSQVSKPYVSEKKDQGGTGLGLPMVIEMVEQHSGAVRIESAPSEGTCVSVLLPRPDSRSAGDTRKPDGSSGEPDAPSSDFPSLSAFLEARRRRATVLLIDDNPPVRTFMRYYIEQHGYRVLDAECERAARRLTDEFGEDIDLMIVDTVLPTRPGTDLANEIQQADGQIPVIFYSKHSYAELVESGNLSPDDTFLQEPFHAGELIETIDQLCNDSGLHNRLPPPSRAS